ncbi:hypothetical protein SEUCBS139899_004729 [Sporothrix eucalyptigena]
MDVGLWYAVVFASLLAGAVVVCFLIFTTSRIATTFALKKHVTYANLPVVLQGSDRAAWIDYAVLFLFLLANVLVLAIRNGGAAGFVRRSASLALANLVPLFLGGRINSVADVFGLRLRTFRRLHRWLGRVAVVEGLVHAIAAVALRKPDVRQRADVAGIVAATALFSIAASGVLRQRLHEVFLVLHFVLYVAIIAAVFVHSQIRAVSAYPAICLLVAICLYAATSALRVGLVLYRSVPYKEQTPNRASVRTVVFKTRNGADIVLSDVVHVHVELARPWRLQAGQFAYLCIPGVSPLALVQSHPFYVAWWYREGGKDYAIFIVQRERGFTRRLASRRDDTKTMLAAVEGPYGKQLHLANYGTVLLMATGIGIAGQLPYVSQLLEEFHKYEVRKIALYWQVNSDIQTALVADQMQELLNKDTSQVCPLSFPSTTSWTPTLIVGQILNIHVYVLDASNICLLDSTNDQERAASGHVVRLGERMDVTYKAIRAADILTFELGRRNGRMAVSLVCVDSETRADVYRVLGKVDEDVSVKELDFSPQGKRSGWM